MKKILILLMIILILPSLLLAQDHTGRRHTEDHTGFPGGGTLTFDKVCGLRENSIPFADATGCLAEENSDFYYDYSTNGFYVSGIITGGSQVRAEDGGDTAPTFSFTSDIDTGMYLHAVNTLGFSTVGSMKMIIAPTYIEAGLPFRGADGSYTVPSYTFINDTNTGFYSSSADVLGISTKGTEVALFGAGGEFYSRFGIILDDNTTDSPGIDLISGSNNDTWNIYNKDDATAGDSDLYVVAPNNKNSAQVIFQGSDTKTFCSIGAGGQGFFRTGIICGEASTEGTVSLNRTSYEVLLRPPVTLSADYHFYFPPNDGNNNEVLTTDGNGHTTFEKLDGDNLGFTDDSYLYLNTAGTVGIRYNSSGYLEINEDLVPSSTYDLGTDANRWGDLYLSGSSLHLGSSGDEVEIGYNTASDYVSINQAVAINYSGADGILTVDNPTSGTWNPTGAFYQTVTSDDGGDYNTIYVAMEGAVTTTGSLIGIDVSTNNQATFTTPNIYSVKGSATNNGTVSTNMYGGYFTASGTATQTVGIFGSATGGSSNWAGYFNQGDVFIANNLNMTSDDFIYFDSAGTKGFSYDSTDTRLEANVDIYSNSSLEIGTATNYFEVSNSGSVTLYGTAKVTKQIDRYAYNMVPVSGTFNSVVCNTAGSVTIDRLGYMRSFDKNVEHAMAFTMVIPTDYEDGSDFKIHLHWTSSETTGGVRWAIGVRHVATGEDYTQTETYYGVTGSAPSTTYYRESDEVTISGSGVVHDEDTQIVIFRDTGHGGDDINGDCYISNVTIEYTSNKLGE